MTSPTPATKTPSQVPPIYCINLPTASGRKERMVRRFRELGLDSQVTFVSAFVHTSDLIPYYMGPASTAPREREQRKRVVACRCSHLLAVRLFLADVRDRGQTGDSWGIICEDDLRLARDFPQRWVNVRENCLPGTPCVLLSYLLWEYTPDMHWTGKEPQRQNLSTIGFRTWGAQMYAVTAAYAQKILEKFDCPDNLLTQAYQGTGEIITSELPLRESRHCGGCLAHPPLALEECSPSQIQADPQSPQSHAQALAKFNQEDYQE